MVKPLQRNALIALANLGGREAIPQIILCLNDQRPVIRGTVAWSLGQLAKREPEQSLEALNYLLSVETEEEVIEEAQKAIHLLTSKKEAAQRSDFLFIKYDCDINQQLYLKL